MTKIKVSVKESEETKPRVAVMDTTTDIVRTSDGREIPTEKVVKVFPSNKPKK